MLVKLTPSVADIAAIAAAAAEGGAHGLVLINTVRGIAIDRDTLQPLLGGGGGGLSGPAVKPVALHAVYHARAVHRPADRRHGRGRLGAGVIEYLAAGAAMVGIGTCALRESGSPPAIVLDELAELLRRHGADRVANLLEPPIHPYQGSTQA